MASPNFSAHWNQLLRNASYSSEGHSHLVQLYENDDFLAEAVGLFVGTGLKLGEGAIIVATPAHLQAFRAALEAQAINVEEAEQTGQLIVADARETLEMFVIEGVIHADKFQAAFDQLFAKLPSSRHKLRLFGEVVGLLWDEGHIEAVQRLEQLWNGILRRRPCSVMCGYGLKVFRDSSESFQEMCELHSHVLPSESFLKTEVPDEQLYAVAQLQQKAQILEFELAKRKQVELSLRASLAEKQMAEDLLLTSETFRNAIVDHSFDCIKVLDLNANLVFINENGMRQIEAECLDKFAGSNWLGFWRGEFKELASEAIEAAKAGKVGDFIGYMQAFPLKRSMWWHVVISPLKDTNGRVVKLLAVSRDVTEIKRIEYELRQAIHVRDEFLSMASHELRTPITSLRLQLEMAREKLCLRQPITYERLEKTFSISCRQVQRLTSLVENMLDVSTFQETKPRLKLEAFDLTSLVREILDGFHHQLDSARCHLVLELEEVNGVWDKSRIEQVIVNLITNALKYAYGHPVQITLSNDQTTARLSVKDSGPGIARERQATIFQRHQQGASRNVSGLGLGLFITEQIVQAHDGQIHLNSSEGEGAEFIVTLPLQPSQTTNPPEGVVYSFVPLYQYLKQSYECNDTHH